VIVIDIVQTIGGLLRHPTHEITRIIIELSTAKSTHAVPGTIRFLISDHPRQVKIPMCGAFGATSLVIDSVPLRSPEALNAAPVDSTNTNQPHWGNSPVIPNADRIPALHPPSSHTKRLMLRNSRRPYPPIQLLAQRREGEPSAFAPPRQGEGFTSTSGHHQSNEMDSVVENSYQLALCRKSSPFGASANSGVCQEATAGDISAVIGLVENTRPSVAR